MTEKSYAFIRDGKVVDLALFDDPSAELLQQFKHHHKVDEILEATSKAMIDGAWDGESFITIKPFASWVLNEAKDWVAPTPYPTDGKSYVWDESVIGWVEATID